MSDNFESGIWQGSDYAKADHVSTYKQNLMLRSGIFDEQFFLRDVGNNTGLNIDITHRCPMQCSRCQRQQYPLRAKEGVDVSLQTIEKLCDAFKSINFSGQYSDPIHHPKFIDIMKMVYDKKVLAIIHNASSSRSKNYYIKAFKANPYARWWFGIDGLPKDSHKYRVNQDGEKLFDIMLEAKKHLKLTPVWQYIIFKYNENDIDTCRQMARDNGLYFISLNSSKWTGDDDPLMPTKEEHKVWMQKW